MDPLIGRDSRFVAISWLTALKKVQSVFVDYDLSGE